MPPTMDANRLLGLVFALGGAIIATVGAYLRDKCTANCSNIAEVRTYDFLAPGSALALLGVLGFLLGLFIMWQAGQTKT